MKAELVSTQLILKVKCPNCRLDFKTPNPEKKADFLNCPECHDLVMVMRVSTSSQKKTSKKTRISKKLPPNILTAVNVMVQYGWSKTELEPVVFSLLKSGRLNKETNSGELVKTLLSEMENADESSTTLSE
jgi:hypothetical protein